MNIRYYEWKCCGCEQFARFIGDHPLSPFPSHWLRIKSTPSTIFFSEKPQIDTCVCSWECLEKAQPVIEKHFRNDAFVVVQNREINAFFCDYCAKAIYHDLTNPDYGRSGSSKDWITEQTDSKSRHFCSRRCQSLHLRYPDKSFICMVERQEVFGIPFVLLSIDHDDESGLKKRVAKRVRPLDKPRISFH
jgi:hypothetical protein